MATNNTTFEQDGLYEFEHCGHSNNFTGPEMDQELKRWGIDLDEATDWRWARRRLTMRGEIAESEATSAYRQGRQAVANMNDGDRVSFGPRRRRLFSITKLD